jgi:hypothetical protein
MAEPSDYTTLQPERDAPRKRSSRLSKEPNREQAPVVSISEEAERDLQPVSVELRPTPVQLEIPIFGQGLGQSAPHVPVHAAPSPDPIPSGAHRRAAEVGQLCLLSSEAKALLDHKQMILPFLYRLMNQRLLPDAVRFLAQALPVREGVWWACQCVQDLSGLCQAVEATAAVSAASHWLAEPTESNRQTCGAAARAAGYGTAAGSAALAVFLSGGSLAPPHRHAVHPNGRVAGQAIANAVLLTALSSEPGRTPERWFPFLKRGIGLLTGVAQAPSNGKK